MFQDIKEESDDYRLIGIHEFLSVIRKYALFRVFWPVSGLSLVQARQLTDCSPLSSLLPPPGTRLVVKF